MYDTQAGTSGAESGGGAGERVEKEIVEGDVPERGLVGGFEDDGRGFAGVESFFPAVGAEAPLVTGLDAGEAPLGARRGKVVAAGLAEFQKLFGGANADDVDALVVGSGFAAAGAVEARLGVMGAGLQRAAENVQAGFFRIHTLTGCDRSDPFRRKPVSGRCATFRVMTKFISAALLLASVLSAKDSDFNGRWNIDVKNEARARAWWLEVEGAGSKLAKGKFVGAPGGDMDVIPSLTVDGGELRFEFTRQFKTGPKELWNQMRRGVYLAKLQNGRLMGTFALDGHVVYQFTGTRAPAIRDRDDASWKPGRPVELMNGKDLSAWTAMVAGQPLGWAMENGSAKNVAGANNLVSKETFWNFDLHAEYKLGEHTNGGVGLRGRYEVQILEDFGQARDTHSHGALYSRIAPVVNASRPVGAWQTMDVHLVGRWVTVTLNGQKVIDHREIEGLTAIAGNGDEANPGPFIVQGDHGAVEFRKFTVTPLVR